MIKPAQKYINEIQEQYIKYMYNLDYQWYFGWSGTAIPTIPDNNYDRHYFASVDSKNNVIGLITYSVDYNAMSCYNFGIISFDKGNLLFIKDVKKVIDDIFYKYNFNRLDFNCFSDNPALRGYRNFIKRYGGREVGIFKQCKKLMDGKIYDSVIFEILKKDYKGRKNNEN